MLGQDAHHNLCTVVTLRICVYTNNESNINYQLGAISFRPCCLNNATTHAMFSDVDCSYLAGRDCKLRLVEIDDDSIFLVYRTGPCVRDAPANSTGCGRHPVPKLRKRAETGRVLILCGEAA
jgi:hypothetical protein